MSTSERWGITLLLAVATLALLWIISPFRSAIIWATAAGFVCRPIFERLTATFRGHRSLAAAATVVILVLILILPTCIVALVLAREATALMSGGEILPHSIEDMRAALPDWTRAALRFVGEDDLASVRLWAQKLLSESLLSVFGGVLGFGKRLFAIAVQLAGIVYLAFFLVRDGPAIWDVITNRLPLPERHRIALVQGVSDVMRATLRGTLVVALVQGGLGGLTVWTLGMHAPVIWGSAMAIAALLPPLGASIIWLPLAAYLILAGQIGKAIPLILSGMLLIGLIDNWLRPVLVGRTAHLPEYLVFLSTLGGLALLGIDGIIVGPVVAAVFVLGWRSMTLPHRPDPSSSVPFAQSEPPERTA